jgi:hypothetical protein
VFVPGVKNPLPPGFVAPCLPSPSPKPPSGSAWVHQIKHDGYRLIARREGNRVRLYTRRGYDWSGKYPWIVDSLLSLRVRSIILLSCLLLMRGVTFFVALCLPFLFITAASAQGEVSIHGLFCETPEQIDSYIVQQQNGKSAEDAYEEVLKQDMKHSCALVHVMSRGIQAVGRTYQFLGKTVGVFAVNVVAILPFPGKSEPPYKQLDHPIIAYTPLAI